MKKFNIEKAYATGRFLFLSFILTITVYACQPAKPIQQAHVNKPDPKTTKVDTAAKLVAYPTPIRECCKGNPSRFRALSAKSQ